jgi:hypothetical protein
MDWQNSGQRENGYKIHAMAMLTNRKSPNVQSA